MTTENRDDRDFDDSMTSEGGAARKADGAIRDTAQKYLDRSGIKVDLQQIEESYPGETLAFRRDRRWRGIRRRWRYGHAPGLADAYIVWPPGRSRNGEQLHQQRITSERSTNCTAQKSLSRRSEARSSVMMNFGSRKIAILAGASAGILIVRAAAPTILTWLANVGVQKVPGYRGRVRRVSIDFTTPRVVVQGLSLAKLNGGRPEHLLHVGIYRCRQPLEGYSHADR